MTYLLFTITLSHDFDTCYFYFHYASYYDVYGEYTSYLIKNDWYFVPSARRVRFVLLTFETKIELGEYRKKRKDKF